MSINDLEEIWKEFGISEQTTTMMVARIQELNHRDKSKIERIVFTPELLIWVCDDPFVSQSIEEDISPRKREEFMISFFRRKQSPMVQRVNTLYSLREPMEQRYVYLRDKQDISEEEELERGDTYSNLGTTMHTICAAFNSLMRENREELLNPAIVPTISVEEILELPNKVREKR